VEVGSQWRVHETLVGGVLVLEDLRLERAPEKSFGRLVVKVDEVPKSLLLKLERNEGVRESGNSRASSLSR
jgi:hypothetical protein